MVVFGTRPEAIKLFPVIKAFQRAPGLYPLVCATGQHRAMLDQVLEIAEITPDHDLDIMTPGQSLDSLTANLINAIGTALDTAKPDVVLVQGDTQSAMCGALAAYYRHIPVAHVEAGLRSGDIYNPWPEEINRKIIGNIASWHFAPTQTAAEALRAENIDPGRIHITGNTCVDALHWVAERIDTNPALAADLHPIERRFAGRRIIVATCHRRENQDGGLASITNAISTLARRDDLAFVIPIHPNPKVRNHFEAALGSIPNVALIPPLNYPHFVRLLQIAHLVLTDSGGIQEEAPTFGKPVLIMRETTERPEGVTAGTAQLVGTDTAKIIRETCLLLDSEENYAAMARAHNPFGDGKAARRIAKIMSCAAAS